MSEKMPCEYNYTDCIEIGQIAAILAEAYLNQLYKQSNMSYIYASYVIGEWAVEFFDKHRDVDWEDILISPQDYSYPQDLLCWDDAVLYFGGNKLVELIKD